VKHRIGIVGALVVGASFLYACANSAPDAEVGTTDLSTHVAALSVNGDGSDEPTSDDVSDDESHEPIMARGCGFSEIVANVVARFDVDQNGDLDATEQAALEASYGEGAEHPNRGQPTRAALLLEAYDADGSGSLEASELETLQGDIQARCEERRSRLVAEFDVNGDGTLDESEWEAARAALRARIADHHHERIAEFDTNGDGTLDEAERTAMRAALHERHASVEAEFDDDGDGSLSDDERDELEEYRRDCVKGDRPMDSREAAIEHRGHGRDGVEEQGDEVEESADGDSESEAEEVDSSADEATETTPAADDTSGDEAADEAAEGAI